MARAQRKKGRDIQNEVKISSSLNTTHLIHTTRLRFINVSSSHRFTHPSKPVRKKQQTITFTLIDSVSVSTFTLHPPLIHNQQLTIKTKHI